MYSQTLSITDLSKLITFMVFYGFNQTEQQREEREQESNMKHCQEARVLIMVVCNNNRELAINISICES